MRANLLCYLFSFLVVIFFFSSCEQENKSKQGKNINQITEENESITGSNNAANTPSESTSPIMTFDKVIHDFGTINEGDVVRTVFNFTNTGKSDLVITDARSSCGCTVPEFPRNKPIAPGGKGKIVVSFDSNYRPNQQQKMVNITANTASGRENVRIKANVIPDPVKQKQREKSAAARKNNK